MTEGAAPSSSDRNMGLLADVWENKKAEMTRDVGPSCKPWDPLLLNLLPPAWPYVPETPQPPETVLAGDQVFKHMTVGTPHSDQAEAPLHCEF